MDYLVIVYSTDFNLLELQDKKRVDYSRILTSTLWLYIPTNIFLALFSLICNSTIYRKSFISGNIVIKTSFLILPLDVTKR